VSGSLVSVPRTIDSKPLSKLGSMDGQVIGSAPSAAVWLMAQVTAPTQSPVRGTGVSARPASINDPDTVTGLDIEKLGVVPNILDPNVQEDAPAGRKGEVRK